MKSTKQSIQYIKYAFLRVLFTVSCLTLRWYACECATYLNLKTSLFDFATLCTTLYYIATNTHTCKIVPLTHFLWHLTYFIKHTWKCLVVDLQLVLMIAEDCAGWWGFVDLLSCPWFYVMFPSTFWVICAFLSHPRLLILFFLPDCRSSLYFNHSFSKYLSLLSSMIASLLFCST